jgi:hypothetical protein
MKGGQIMKAFKIIFGLFMALFLSLLVPRTILCQTESFDIVQYTAPIGWIKNPQSRRGEISWIF